MLVHMMTTLFRTGGRVLLLLRQGRGGRANILSDKRRSSLTQRKASDVILTGPFMHLTPASLKTPLIPHPHRSHPEYLRMIAPNWSNHPSLYV